MNTRARNLIDGQWVGDPTVERHNPAHPSQTAAISPDSTTNDVDAALVAARQAQPAWAALPAPARGTVLLDAADLLRQRRPDIARDLVEEEGKTLPEASGEVRRAIDLLRYYGSAAWQSAGGTFPSSAAATTIYAQREPIGIAALITPWNFPIAIPTWKAAPALVTGNAVVLKPAELTPLSANHLAAALVDAGLPPGVLNVVHGQGSVVGAALAQDSRVGALSFTGSTTVGLELHKILSARRARVQLEMGGKNGYLVLDDADASRAAATIAAGAFGLTGQACTATSRVYCTPAIKDEFVNALVAGAAAYRPGDGLADSTTMGPVVSEEQLQVDVQAIQRAHGQGATVVTGGSSADGQLLPPTILTDLASDADAVRDEIFGPVLVVLTIADLDEGIAQINASRYGLTAGICTTSLAAAHHFADQVQVGVVKVNRPTTGLDLNVPFGGVKDSSTNTFREQGPNAVDFYTWTKTVYLGHDGA
ncbi:MAG: aldehyde dehydrogenase family protein [Mycobacteriales bacterium]